MKHQIELPRHLDHSPNMEHGDPRKKWCYDCLAGKWAAEDKIPALFRHLSPRAQRQSGILGEIPRVYSFENEQDAVMFTLRWSADAN